MSALSGQTNGSNNLKDNCLVECCYVATGATHGVKPARSETATVHWERVRAVYYHDTALRILSLPLQANGDNLSASRA